MSACYRIVERERARTAGSASRARMGAREGASRRSWARPSGRRTSCTCPRTRCAPALEDARAFKDILSQTPRKISDHVQFIISLFCLNYQLLLDYPAKDYESMICDILISDLLTSHMLKYDKLKYDLLPMGKGNNILNCTAYTLHVDINLIIPNL